MMIGCYHINNPFEIPRQYACTKTTKEKLFRCKMIMMRHTVPGEMN